MFNKEDRERFNRLYSEICEKPINPKDLLPYKLEKAKEENKNLLDRSIKTEIENAKLKNELDLYKMFVNDFLKKENENTKTIFYKGDLYLITDFSLSESCDNVELNSLVISCISTNLKIGDDKNE